MQREMSLKEKFNVTVLLEMRGNIQAGQVGKRQSQKAEARGRGGQRMNPLLGFPGERQGRETVGLAGLNNLGGL